jgi:UDP-2,3-diacylglucosamine hydrolase
MLVSWLEEIKEDVGEIFLMGDVFDFWYEYKSVVPKGYVRLLGKLAELTDSGIPVHLFKGNHDIWAFDYLENEININLHRKPKVFEFGEKSFYLAHGDGLGPGDNGYKFLKKVFENRFNQWLFRWLHPDLGAGMALYFSKRSRIANVIKEGKKEEGGNIEEEMLYHYVQSLIDAGAEHDYYIFGHRHLPTDHLVKENVRMIILGDWITNFSYAVFDGNVLELKYYTIKK